MGKKTSTIKEKLRDDIEQEDQPFEIEETESKIEVEGDREEQEFNEIVTVDEKVCLNNFIRLTEFFSIMIGWINMFRGNPSTLIELK